MKKYWLAALSALLIAALAMMGAAAEMEETRKQVADAAEFCVLSELPDEEAPEENGLLSNGLISTDGEERSVEPNADAPQANDGDFEIVDGVLVKYNGAGGEVAIPGGVTAIGDSAFKYCSGLTKVTIPDSVKSIGSWAFNGTGLTEIVIPNSVTSMGMTVFQACEKLTTAVLPSGITSISEFMFTSCFSLTDVTIPNGITSIENYAFAACGKLEDLTIPESVTSIADNAFSYCSKLVIHGKAGSAAETFAKSHDIPFVAEGGKPTAKPTAAPTAKPTVAPTAKPTATPTVKPTTAPTAKPTTAPTKVKLNKTKATLGVKETLTLTATLTPSSAGTTLTWTSDKPKIASVDANGKVTGLKAGTAKITVTTANGKKAAATITVKAAPKKVTLNKTGTVTLKKGKTLQLKATLPKNTASALTWTSSDEKVATVNENGKVAAVKAGTATITVQTFNGKKASVKIKVK